MRKGDKGGLYRIRYLVYLTLKGDGAEVHTSQRKSKVDQFLQGRKIFSIEKRRLPPFCVVNGILEAAEPFLLNLQIPCLLRYDLFTIGGNVGWPAIIMLIESYYSLLPVCALFQSFCHIKFMCMCCRIFVWFFVY